MSYFNMMPLQEEQDFLMRLVGLEDREWGLTFWMSGNSVPSSRSSGQWSWGAPYVNPNGAFFCMSMFRTVFLVYFGIPPDTGILLGTSWMSGSGIPIGEMA